MSKVAAMQRTDRAAPILAVMSNRFKLIQELYKWQKPPYVLQ